MVFLLGALCYTICTMKAPPQALHGMYHFMAFLQKPPLQRRLLERRLHGIPVWCSVLYNMHYEGSWKGRGGASMAFKLAKVLGNSHAPHGSGLALINCIVADHSQL